MATFLNNASLSLRRSFIACKGVLLPNADCRAEHSDSVSSIGKWICNRSGWDMGRRIERAFMTAQLAELWVGMVYNPWLALTGSDNAKNEFFSALVPSAGDAAEPEIHAEFQCIDG